MGSQGDTIGVTHVDIKSLIYNISWQTTNKISNTIAIITMHMVTEVNNNDNNTMVLSPYIHMLGII